MVLLTDAAIATDWTLRVDTTAMPRHQGPDH